MGKGSGQKVYDYRYSLDFGICHGPVDSINMVWVKEKPIFCGAVSSRMDVCVEMPDIFGGDLKEGGVSGVIEFYPGSDDQVSSAALAARAGLTPETFPGYRGQAHVFFRGYGDSGFKWATNNYYLPTVEFHVTCLPKSLGAQYSAIWPMGEDPPDGIEAGEWQGNWVPFDEAEQSGLSPFVVPRASFAPIVSPETLVSDLDSVEGSWLRIEDGGASPDCGSIITEVGYVQDPDAPKETDESGEPLDTSDDMDQRTRRRMVGSFASLSVECQYTGSIEGIDPTSISASVRVESYAGGVDNEGREIVGPRLASDSQVRLSRGAATAQAYIPISPAATWIRKWGTFNPMFPLFTTSRVTEATGRETFARDIYEHCLADGTLGTMPDANPAHMLYEIMVNPEWGKGEHPSMINTESFLACAETLFNERFGLSLMFTRQGTIESYAQEVLDHISAFLFQNPETGLWEMKLLRGDYEAGTLPWLNPSNCSLRNPKRRRWGETVNEITVSYTDPATEEEATVTAQNLANMAVQGGKNPETRNYHGVRNARLAQVIANRDVVEAGTPLWGATVDADRTFWAAKPGDVFRIFWPEENIESMVVRVMSVDRGRKGARPVQLTVVEDIFSVDAATFSEPQAGLWSDDVVFPSPMPRQIASSVPFPEMLLRGADPDDTEGTSRAAVVVLAAAPGQPVRDYQFWVRPPAANQFVLAGTAPPIGFSTISEGLAEEAFSSVPRAVVDAAGGGFLQPGTRLMLVPEGVSAPGGVPHDDRKSEIVILRSFDSSTQTWLLQRGAYDTVPAEWPAGSELWVYPDGEEYLANVVMAPSDDEPVRFRALPRTRAGRLSIGATPTVSSLCADRLHLPFRPANCQIDDAGFSPVVYEDEPWPSSVRASWSNRDRFAEDVEVPPAWDDGDIASEDGVFTRLYLSRTQDGSPFASFDAAPGDTFYDIPVSSFAGVSGGQCYVRFTARNAAGDESLQSASRFVRVGGLAGWGYAWGSQWGG